VKEFETTLMSGVPESAAVGIRADAGPLVIGNATLHHLGFVVKSIVNAAESFALAFSAHWDRHVTHDPMQRARVAFFYPRDERNPVFELVEPAGEDSPVALFLTKGGGLHHACYEVDDLGACLHAAPRARLAVISQPTPAVAFDGRRIAWVGSRNRLLMELLERGGK
jgi:methylmalonyl-CoA/ethylmalonyl-CoA epimerase